MMNSSIKIGVVGFSSNQFDQDSAKNILNGEFEKLFKRYSGKREVEIVSGYTSMGVPKIAYQLADKYDFIKVGFSARQALKVKSGVYKVDKEILIGDRFGEESEEFIKYIDGLIRVGGGKQSRKEVELFKIEYSNLPLDRILKEYEVEWFGNRSKKFNKRQMLSMFDETTSKVKVVNLDSENQIKIYRGIDQFRLLKEEFTKLWNTHPDKYHEVMMHGKLVKTPRWQQSYGKNYEYSGYRNNALPIQNFHKKYLEWSKNNVDERINGILINWYSGTLGHYIGKHRDSIKGLQSGSPIITISHGGDRVFRFRPYSGKGYKDFILRNGDVVVIPWKTNQIYTHEVPHLKKYNDDRISVTLRAFD